LSNISSSDQIQVFSPSLNMSLLAGMPEVFEDIQGASSVTPSSHRVYNFEVAEHHTYIADGIRVHNTSVLSFLNPEQFQNVNFDSLDDLDGDGNFDYVELDNNLGGLQAEGTTIYKMETVGGQTIARAYVTHADEQGRLVQSTFLQGADGQIIEGSQSRTVLTGAQFGEQAGRLVTPFITAAILSEDASVFERFATDTILGTFVQNSFEFAGGAIHDHIASGGLQNNTLDDIASITFADFTDDLITNGVDSAQSLLSQWIMAEVFEGLSTDEFGGKLSYLLAEQGVNYLLDVSVHTIATDVLGLSADEINRFGLNSPQFDQVFSGANLLNLVFKAAIGTVLPALESTEAQIGSGLITLALDIFAGIGGVWGSVIGYIGGQLLDLIFDEDPSSFTEVVYSIHSGRLQVAGTDAEDGGTVALSRGAADAFADFVNGVLDRAQSSSNNLEQLAQSMTLVFGHDEEDFRNGDNRNYDTIQEALTARIIETLSNLELVDGDAKFAAALQYLADNTSTADSDEILNEVSMRFQVANDYQAYLENKEEYDALIAADPQSAFAAGWATTFLLAREYGFAEDFRVTGDANSSVHITSSGDDSVVAGGGDDLIRTLAGDDTLRGGTGDDTLLGGSGDDYLDGQEGNDVFFGGSGNDTMRGGWGIDQFYVGLGNNLLLGGNSEDIVTFDGVFADYTVVNNGSNDLTVTHRETGAVTRLNSIEFLKFENTVRTYDPAYDTFLTGTAEDDLLNGTDLHDAINGLGGDDIIYGFDGDDFLSGDAGDDQIFGGLGDDWIFGVLGNDMLYGGPGNDPISGGEHEDYLWGDSGNDTLDGDGGDDVLNGGTGYDVIRGGSGDDLLEGSSGRDTLEGGNGDDDLYGGADGDVLRGGSGDDYIDAGGGWNRIEAGNGDDYIVAGSGSDTIYGNSGDDTVYAGDGNDVIFQKRYVSPKEDKDGSLKLSSNDWGSDLVYAGGGDDSIYSIGDNDVVFAGSGNDLVVYDGYHGGAISGGSGNDSFVFEQIYVDIQWYTSANRELAAVFDHSQGDHSNYPDHQYVVVKGFENFYFERNGTTRVAPEYTARNGYTGDGFAAANTVTLSDAAWDARFSDDAFLDYLNIGYHPESRGRENGNNDEITPNPGDTDTIQLGGGASFFGRFGDMPSDFSGDEYRIEDKSGSQKVNGGNGDDVILTGSGSDSIWGGDGNDHLSGESGADYINAGRGTDSIAAGTGDDEVHGGWNSDSIRGGSGHDTLYGDQHNDTIYGDDGRDFISGGSGSDELRGGSSPDTIEGGDGSDLIFGGDGGDDLDGGADNDTIDGGLGIDKIVGGTGSDQLSGGDGSDEIYGQDNNDTISGGNAADNLFGGEGDDRISGDSGNDNLLGENGSDTLIGGAGADSLDGGSGRDAAYFDGASTGVGVNLKLGMGFAGEAEFDRYRNIENIRGSNHSDEIIGNDGGNWLDLLGGNDTVRGEDGNDTIAAGSGNDIVDGGAGDDSVNGDSGSDDLSGGTGQDTLNGGQGNDNLSGGDGADTLYGSTDDDTLNGGADADYLRGDSGHDHLFGDAGNDNLIGGSGNDELDGGAGADLLSGGDGNDVLFGSDGADSLNGGSGSDNLSGGQQNDVLNGDAGNDVLSGEAGNDVLSGGDGADILAGGAGNDMLTGGAGADGFVSGFNQGLDTVTDFQIGTDKIALSDGDYQVVLFEDANGVKVRLGLDSSIYLEGIAASALSVSDFSVSNNASLTLTVSDKPDFFEYALLSSSSAGGRVDGGDGSDLMIGGIGNDDLRGGKGTDYLVDGAGADVLRGGQDADYFELGADGHSDRITDFDASMDIIDISAWGITSFSLLTFSVDDAKQRSYLHFHDESIRLDAFGQSDVDALNGNAFVFYSSPHTTPNIANLDAVVSGSAGGRSDGTDNADYMRGGAGNDDLRAGHGDDYLVDNGGYDTMRGGNGADYFRMVADGSGDRITDFDASEDVLDISAWGVTFIGELTFTVDEARGRSELEFRGETIRLDGYTQAMVDALQNDNFVFNDGPPLPPEEPDDVSSTPDLSTYNTMTSTTSGGRLDGTDGSDLMTGASANDNLRAGKGDDYLIDGAGVDDLRGGQGADYFEMVADGDSDRITDFDAFEDTLDISAWGVTSFDQLSFSVDTQRGRSYLSYNDESIRLDGYDQAMVDALNGDGFIFA